jgi:tetratricopeptide (TPR) repeat protein
VLSLGAFVIFFHFSLCGQQVGKSLLEQARQLTAEGHYQQASSIYEKLAQQQPHSAEILIDLGVSYANEGRYSLAGAAYRRAINIDPHSIPAWMNLGLAYFKAGNFSAAITPLSKVLAYEATNLQARTLLAMSYYSVGSYGPASRQFEALLTAEPNNTTVQYLLADSYLHSHQEKCLLDFLQKLLQSSPNSATVHMLMGEAYDNLGRTSQAIEEFKAAEAEAPSMPLVHFGLGYFYWEQRLFTQAAAEFQREIDSRGNQAVAMAYLGEIALRGGNPEKAQPLLQEALRQNPKIRIAHFDLGIIYTQKKKYAQAEEELERAIALDPKRPDAFYRLAQVYRFEGKTQLEKDALGKVAQLREAERATLMEEIPGLFTPKDER